MVSLTSLWLAILLSAVLAFIVSALFHVVLPWHRYDYAKLPGEDVVLEAMHQQRIPPGDYAFPYAATPELMGAPETAERYARGPVGFTIIKPSGPPAMGGALAKWFVYLVAVCFLIAYLTSRTLAPGTPYLQVFRVAGTIGFLAFAWGEPVMSIWYGRRWVTTAKNMVDGLVYGLMTGGVFGWLWPE